MIYILTLIMNSMMRMMLAMFNDGCAILLSLPYPPSYSRVEFDFDVYCRITKAFRAIAPSSVVFQKWLEHLDWTKVKRKKRKVKVETRLPPLSLFSSKHTKVTTMEKNNFWILQLLFPPASAPPLPPSPSNTEAWWPPHLTQWSKGRVVNQEVLSLDEDILWPGFSAL